MSTAFLFFLALHILHSIVTSRGEEPQGPRRLSFVAAITQIPVFVLACYLGFQQGAVSRQLVNPAFIGAGLLAGHLIFGLSLLITHRSWRDAASHFFDVGAIWNYTMDSPIILTRFLSVSVAEELIWRVVAQPLLISVTGNVVAGITIVAVGFSLVHRHFFRNPLLVSFEFLCFALLLGCLYAYTGSLILVIVVHAVRDLEIAYLEYLIKVEELGDPQQAARVMEQAYWSRRPENT
ncbi:MAG: CPBP family intramembrane metalloprotease [Candidatus Hydrogenedentes bacterium]|nr:CPBP family intramembrane metalloprotease [Candidatus Hydrogenedentota bacterium]